MRDRLINPAVRFVQLAWSNFERPVDRCRGVTRFLPDTRLIVFSCTHDLLQRLLRVKRTDRGWTAGEYAVVRAQRNAADTETGLAKLLTVKLEWTASAESD